MLKKLFVGVITLMVICGVVYAGNYEFQAASSSYMAGGDITGRVNMIPNEIVNGTLQPMSNNNGNFGMQKGDKVYIGVDNPADGTPLGWQLIYYDKDYTDYTDPVYITDPVNNNDVLVTPDTATKGAPLSAWFAGSVESIGNVQAVDRHIFSKKVSKTVTKGGKDYTTTFYMAEVPDMNNITEPLHALNTDIKWVNNKIVKDRDLSDLRDMNNYLINTNWTPGHVINSYVSLDVMGKNNLNDGIGSGKKATYLVAAGDADASWKRGFFDSVKKADLSFGTEFWSLYSYYPNWTYVDLNGNRGDVEVIGQSNVQNSVKCTTISTTSYYCHDVKKDLRPFAFLDVQETVFAVSPGISQAIGNVTESKLSNSYASLYADTINFDNLKLRLLDSDLKADLNYISSGAMNTTQITQTFENAKININVDAEIVTSTHTGIKTISVLVFDSNNQFVYYKPLNNAIDGAANYEFDTTGMAVGNYKIGVVNEIYDEGSTAPSYSSLISDVMSLEIVKALEISYTSKPQNQSTYEYTKNTNSLDQVGELTYQFGVPAYTFNAISYPNASTAHANDYKNFEVVNPNGSATQASPMNVRVKQTGPQIDSTTQALKPGVYQFRIQGYDANGDPVSVNGSNTHPIDKNGDEVTTIPGVDKGRVTDDIELVVYPTDTQFTYSQLTKTDYSYYKASEVDADTLLGEVDISNDANISGLLSDGYGIKEIKLYKKGTTTQLPFKAVLDPTDPKHYHIQYDFSRSSTVSAGEFDFDMEVIFEKKTTHDETAKIKKEYANSSDTLKLIIKADLKFANPDHTDQYLTEKPYTYEITYDPVASTKNDILFVASDKASPTDMIAGLQYCVMKSDKSACLPTNDASYPLSDAMSIYATGSAKGNVDAPDAVSMETDGEEHVEFIVRAYEEDSSHTMINYVDMTVKVKPARQKLSWAGTDIQSANNDITKVTGKENEWELALQYDEADPTMNEIDLDILQTNDSETNKHISLKDDVTLSSGIHPDIEYEIQAGAQDTDKIKIENGKLKITADLVGDVTIIAKAKAVESYAKTDTKEEAKLIISVSKKAKVTFSEATPYSIKRTSDEATGIVAIGDLGIDPVSDIGYTFSMEHAYFKAPNASDYGSSSVASDFKLMNTEAGTNNVNYQLYAKNALAKGSYKITVKADKNGTEAAAKEIIIIVEDEIFDVSKMKWQKQLDGQTVYSDVGGTIKNTDKTNTVKLTQTFVDGGQFDVKVAEKSTNYLQGTTIKYEVKDSASGNLINITQNGKVTMKQAGTAYVKATIKKTNYEDCIIYLPIEIGSGTPEFVYVKDVGDPYALIDPDDKSEYDTITFTYTANKQLPIFTEGVPTGADVTFTIVSNGTSTGNDVLEFAKADTGADHATTCTITAAEYATEGSSKCLPRVRNAMDKVRDKGTIVLEATTSATADYASMTIRIPINIDKATQDFKFAKREEYVESNADGMISPAFKETTTGTGKITLFLQDEGGTPDFTAGDVELADPGSDTKYTDQIDSFRYHIQVSEEDEEVFTVYARKEGDRNYKPSNMSQMKVHVVAQLECAFNVTIQDYPTLDSNPIAKVTYGDEFFRLIASSPTDDGTETYTYEIDNASRSLITEYGTDGNTFRPLKADTIKAKIKITRTAADGSIQESYTSILVNQRIVQLQVDDINKKQGQSVHVSDYTFKTVTAVSGKYNDFLAADKAKIKDPVFSCQDVNGKEVTTLPYVEEKHDGLPITASFPNADADTYANYKIVYVGSNTSGIKPGILHVSKDHSQASWFEVKEGMQADGTATMEGKDGWYNGPVDVVLKTNSDGFDEIANTFKQSTVWDPIKFTLTREGEKEELVYFRKSTGTDIGSISEPQKTTIKIDMTKPEVTSLQEELINRDAISKFIHNITMGMYKKPGYEVKIESKDGLSGIDELVYEVYEIDETTGLTGNTVKQGTLDHVTNGNGSVTIDGEGLFRICVIAKDKAGNASDEKCSDIATKNSKIDEDVDGDGTPDFNDPDGDGCPDLNIKWKDQNDSTKWIILNGDRDKDGIPDLNIDSDGDGKADLNIDTDGDGRADVNLVDLTKVSSNGAPSVWKPTICVSQDTSNGIMEEYCTGTTVKPVINIDTDGDQIPDIDIDDRGDFKPHLNISVDGITPHVNIIKFHNWKPKTDYETGSFLYDSIKFKQAGYIATINIDTNGDGIPDVNIDFDGDGVPDLNVNEDGDWIPDWNIDGDGDGIPDINTDIDDTGKPTRNIMDITTWKPTLIGDKEFPFGTMPLKGKDSLTDQDITVEYPDGSIFLPNFALKVTDVTENQKEAVQEKIDDFIEENQEIKYVYDIKLYQDDVEVQPNGKLKVRIPIPEGVENPKLWIQKPDGNFEQMDARIEDGAFVYEADQLGVVSIIGDTDGSNQATPQNKPGTSVQGSYTQGYPGDNVGGAITGDSTSYLVYLILGSIAFGIVFFMTRKGQASKR